MRFFEFPNTIRRLHSGSQRSSAMELLQVRFDTSVIALCVWHKSVAANYLHVYLSHRETAHAKMTPLNTNGLAIARPM